MPITLEEYMPKEFRDLVHTSTVCCQSSGEEDLSDEKNNVEEKANPQRFNHNVCIIESAFSDNNLLFFLC